MGEDGRRRSGEDLISGLPDELLHGILVRLRCARAASRTSVLSRRWRRVWTHLPELHLDDPASSPDTVDGALAGYLAPDLWRLSISPAADLDYRVLAWRAAPWLRFAAERVVGELRLRYVSSRPRRLNPEADLELPACGRAQAITLFLGVEWRLRPRPGGLFSALAALTIRGARIEGGELSNLVCTQCPHLSYLDLFVSLVGASNVTIRSDSLRALRFGILNSHGQAQQLELVGPRLEKLILSDSIQAHISAPKLAELVCRCRSSFCDLHNYQFVDIGRRLRLLEVEVDLMLASLMQRFDEVDVLKLEVLTPLVCWQLTNFLRRN
nr:unnamed protein product [Digitaria exilis]